MKLKWHTLALLFALVIFGLLIAGIVFISLSEESDSSSDTVSTSEITSFQECVDAGFPILEIYPEQCITDDDKVFTRQITQEYYGSSTNSACTSDSDCEVNGCNSEICGVTTQDLFSTCQVPDAPLPQDVGLECGCVNSQCQWN